MAWCVQRTILVLTFSVAIPGSIGIVHPALAHENMVAAA